MKGKPFTSLLLCVSVIMLVSLCAKYFSWHFIENPTRKVATYTDTVSSVEIQGNENGVMAYITIEKSQKTLIIKSFVMEHVGVNRIRQIKPGDVITFEAPVYRETEDTEIQGVWFESLQVGEETIFTKDEYDQLIGSQYFSSKVPDGVIFLLSSSILLYCIVTLKRFNQHRSSSK